MKPTAKFVKTLRPMGWADFKHKLARLGVISSPTADVPEAWKAAFCRAFGRKLA